MELQQARIRGVAHCIIPQEFPVIPLQQLTPVVVGQSPAVQLSGAPAVVQVLVPSNQIIPIQIPVLVPSPAHIINPGVAPTEKKVIPHPVEPPTTPPVVITEAKTVTSYIMDFTTVKPVAVASNAPSQTTTTTTPAPLEIPPEDVPLVPEQIPLKTPEPEVPVPNSSRMHYSADPPTSDELLLDNGLSSMPEVIMPMVAESSHRKLVMQPEDDPPEMLHDQEMIPPAAAAATVDDDVWESFRTSGRR